MKFSAIYFAPCRFPKNRMEAVCNNKNRDSNYNLAHISVYFYVILLCLRSCFVEETNLLCRSKCAF